MHSLGRNNLVGYWLASSGKKEVKIGQLFSPQPTVITSARVGLPCREDGASANMAIADSLGNSISVTSQTLGEFAIAVDGQLTDQAGLLQGLLASNMVLLSKSTEELVTYLLSQEAVSDSSLPVALSTFLAKYPGGYSLLIMTKERIYAARDCYGVKPLVIGRLEATDEVTEYDLEGDRPLVASKVPNVIASASVVLEGMGAKYVRQLLPGEIVELGPTGVRSVGMCYRRGGEASTMCSLGYVTLEAPSSILEDQRVQEVRYRLAQALAVDSPAESDIVITLPNISMAFAFGYVQACGTPLVEAFYYCGSNSETKQLSLYEETVADKTVTVVVDSSLNQELVAALYLLKRSAAKRVHLRLCSPPIVSPCPFGIEVQAQGIFGARELASIGYLRLESLAKAVRRGIPDHEVRNVGHCLRCFGQTSLLHRF